MSIQYLTPSGFTELKKEYDELKTNKIPEIANRIDDAKQQGDLSENAEYHQAREDMSWAKTRLLELDRILENAKVMDEPKNGKDKISIGSTATVKVNGNKKEYTIVGAQEANPLKGLISNESPLGRAFLGRKKDDKMEVVVPAGKQTYEIIEIN
ncbi:MAG: transcription elongation factor GreA [Patescibacteria group bacterium]|jgi:transcription elongation factor GreA|nr:transcription elongation factor GreA [Patescibacteria group bacterium]